MLSLDISLKEIDQVFHEAAKKDQLSTEDLETIFIKFFKLFYLILTIFFKRKPFYLTSGPELLLLERYLTEDPSELWIYFDPK